MRNIMKLRGHRISSRVMGETRFGACMCAARVHLNPLGDVYRDELVRRDTAEERLTGEQ